MKSRRYRTAYNVLGTLITLVHEEPTKRMILGYINKTNKDGRLHTRKVYSFKTVVGAIWRALENNHVKVSGSLVVGNHTHHRYKITRAGRAYYEKIRQFPSLR